MRFTGIGDLAEMLGDPNLTRKYMKTYPVDAHMDKFGFMPPPGVTKENSNTVILGDSFAEVGRNPADTFAGILTDSSGPINLLAYNITYNTLSNKSFSAFSSMYPPIPENANKKHNKLLILILSKRHLNPDTVESIPDYMQTNKHAKLKRLVLSLIPKAIYANVKNKSIIIPRMNQFWKRSRFYVKTDKPSDKVVIGRKGVLFYRGELDSWKNIGDDKTIDGITASMIKIKQQAEKSGFDFRLLMIPDKSDVHPEFLPSGMPQPANDPVAIYFSKIVKSLSDHDIEVTNMLPRMREEARRCNCLLFYPDDTHWNTYARRFMAKWLLEDIKSQK